MRATIKSLHCDCVGVEPVTCDWSEIRGENLDGFDSYEVQECQECGEKFVLNGGRGEERHNDIDYDSKCTGWVSEASGPMMNYWYPISINDCKAVALKLEHLPLCVVEFKGGTTGLALTGGGMNLAWEICEAFMLLGQLPPVHFELPAMCGRGVSKRDEWIIAGARKACQVVAKRMAWQLHKLKDTVKWGRDYAAKQKRSA